MAYRDSDYTVVIATMQQPNRTILVLKLTMVVEIQALLLCRRSPLLDRSLRSSSPVQSYEGPTKILTIQPWSLSLTCQNSPCWLSCECCNNVLSSFWSPLLATTERGCHVACALIRTNCLRYGESQPGLQRGYEWYFRALWIISDLPHLYVAIMVLTSCVIIGTNCHT